jgi:hypothetical protein
MKTGAKRILASFWMLRRRPKASPSRMIVATCC